MDRLIIVKKPDTIFKRFVVSLVSLSFIMSFNVCAAIISVDDIGGFGIDALTRDTDQGLEFLDVTFSIGRSFDDVSGEFGIGGDFDGFRYATVDEVITLANNFGVTPAFVAGNAADIATDIGVLVGFLGETDSTLVNRKTVAMTSTLGPGGIIRKVEFLDELDNTVFMDRISSEVVFAQGSSAVNTFTGSYLVKSFAVPEPATGLLILAGVFSILGMRKRPEKIID